MSKKVKPIKEGVRVHPGGFLRTQKSSHPGLTHTLSSSLTRSGLRTRQEEGLYRSADRPFLTFTSCLFPLVSRGKAWTGQGGQVQCWEP